MRKLDLKEFYGEPSVTLSANGNYSLNASGLITPKQFIRTYNIPGIDESGRLVEALGYHYDTMNTIICNIFRHPVPDDILKLQAAASEVLENTHENYVKIHFVNEKENNQVLKAAYVFVPAFISFSQYIHLRQLDKDLKDLINMGIDIEIGTFITKYSPMSGREIQGLITNGDNAVSLGDMLNYMMGHNRVLNDDEVFVLNAIFEEECFTAYDTDDEPAVKKPTEEKAIADDNETATKDPARKKVITSDYEDVKKKK